MNRYLTNHRLLLVLAVCTAVAVMHLGFGVDLYSSTASAGMLGFALGETEIDMKALLAAIDTSNKAFEDFKGINDKRLKLLEEGKGGAGELKESMEKAFKDMAEQKSLIEKLEAKFNRPVIGNDGKPIDQAAEAHRVAFKGFITRGTQYDEGSMFYKTGLSLKSLSSSSGPDGGFAVPKVIDTVIDQTLIDISPMRAIAKVQQVGTPDFHKLVNIHGTSSGWVGETATRPSTNTPQLVDVAPPMGEIYANPQATQVQLDDAFFDVEGWLGGEVATEFARAEGYAFVLGTGVGQPRGITQYTTVATGDASRTFGQLEYVGTGASGAFKTLSSTVNPVDDLYTLVGKMKAGYRQGSRWMMAKSGLFAIMAMKDYQGRYVFTPTSAPGVDDMILGYPVTEAEDMPAYTTASALGIAFGNFQRGYLIVDRIGTRVLRDPYSNKPYIGFYTTKRVGGGVVNSEAIKFLKFI